MKISYLLALLALLGCAETVTAAISVKDESDHVIALNRPAQRIISLAPDETEMLFAAGAGSRVVGVMRFSDFPAAAGKLPVVGDVQGLDLERIIALKPDLIVVWYGGIPQQQIDRLRELHVPIYLGQARHLDDIANMIEKFGQLMGTESIAVPEARQLRVRLAGLVQDYSRRDPVRVFYQVWDQPLFTLNGQHIVSDALRVCGATNIFANLTTISPSVDLEAVLRADPEAIVGTEEAHPTDHGVMLWKRYPALTAVKRGNLFMIDGNLINRAGPRMIEGTEALCKNLDLARSRRTGG